MEFTDLIRKRESIRNYDPERRIPVPVIKKILEAGRLAPSACNIQPWRFIVVSSPLMLEKTRLCYSRPWFRDAPHILVLVGDREKAWKRGSDNYCSIETDLAIAMTHMILAAENEGIGTCWIANYDPKILKEALEIKENEVICCITPLGYTREGFKKLGSKSRKPLDEISQFI